MTASSCFRSTSATLWPCGTRSTSVRPHGNTVPAGRPPSLAMMATLSSAWMRMYSGLGSAATAWAATGESCSDMLGVLVFSLYQACFSSTRRMSFTITR
ncbi:hypothetical protein D3C85_1585830 [compost metagenome]